jgi:hypothetical protein
MSSGARDVEGSCLYFSYPFPVLFQLPLDVSLSKYASVHPDSLDKWHAGMQVTVTAWMCCM